MERAICNCKLNKMCQMAEANIPCQEQRKGEIMGKIFYGESDNKEFQYCPYCGEHYTEANEDGSAYCEECNKRFAVIEDE